MTQAPAAVINKNLSSLKNSISCFTTRTRTSTTSKPIHKLFTHKTFQETRPNNNQQPTSKNPHPRTQQQNLISLIKSGTQNSLLQIHAHLIRTSLLQNPTFSLHFLSCLCFSPFRDLRYSRHFFSQIDKPSASHYSTLIRAYSSSNSPKDAFFLYKEMTQKGLKPDPVSSSFVLKSCMKFSSLVCGLQIHGRILGDGFQSDSLLLTTLMDFYSSFASRDEACKVFDEISKKDTVAWNVLISCYLRNGRTRDVLILFDSMKNEGACKPDDVTCLLVVQACANLGALDFGEKVHGYIEECGYGVSLNLRNSLIAMYSRCGCLEKAYGVFKGMPEKNVISWSAMISGLAMNGYGRDAILAFEEMQRMGIGPDEQTFTGVLSACSHCGLVDEGMEFLHQMSKEFGIEPNIHHYGCMVDLLGRAGLLDQAYQVIISMGVKPDATIWRTLLGACRIHGHVTLGERVIEHLIELKAQEAGDYVLLLNIYSSDGKWEKVTELRKFMKEKGIQTSPGCSTIELKGVVHNFIVDDISHPRKHEIYDKLDEINKQLKIAGYVAEITSELHDLGAEEKAHALSYHSEKLALAFGVLATPPGTTIRVTKNLRICVDCHNFAKFLSGVYNRKSRMTAVAEISLVDCKVRES
ncbi:Pentatricopeptide repeat - like 10 [Theobroma cacao]|nr:Pentatricopeptide repeat - like 10 [Theobroma cacao]